MNEKADLKLISLGVAIWIGAATTGLLRSWWICLALPLLFLIGKRFGQIFLVAALVGAVNLGLHEIALSHNALRSFVDTHSEVHVVAQVHSDPRRGDAKVVGSTIRAPSTTFLATTIRVDGGKLRLPIRISTHQNVQFSPGTVINFSSILFSTRERTVAALAVTRGAITVLHGPGVMGEITGKIRSAFRNQVARLNGDGPRLIPGLVLGDTSLESSQFISDMRRVGLTHLTAVSGENFVIISAFILWFLQWLIRKLRIRLLLTGCVLICFIFLVRPTPSVLRASVMTAVLLLARGRGERGSALPSLGLAISLLILIDPFQAIDPGFALSVGATAGILLLSPHLKSRLPDVLAIPISATIVCTPIIFALSGQFSLISIPANVLVSPVVAPITIFGFIAALIAPILPSISYIIVIALLPFAGWISFIAHHLSALPIINLPSSFMGAAIALLLLYILFKRLWLIAFLLAAVIGGFFFYQAWSWPDSQWRIVNCDVGQGDGEVINLGEGEAIVIDTGPDPALMDSCLRSLHISTIALLVITHNHADHYGGLSGAIHGRKVGQVWRAARQGDRFSLDAPIGHVSIDVLWPKDPNASFEALPGDGSAINNTSISLVIDIAGIQFFTAGDVEPPAQQAILESGLVHPVDIMKVSHHGSAYQYLPLLDALKPSVAFISVGKGNTYGHPAPSTLQALRTRGIKTFRTDVDGALEYDADRSIHTHHRGLISIG